VVEKGYELYCLADRLFYDDPARASSNGKRDGDSESGYYALARFSVAEGYTRHTLDDWLVYVPEDVHLPSQGWKIHASASLDSAPDILEAVWSYCVPRRIAFKFIAGPELLFLRNLKYAHRGSSGKFVTIYPADEAQLHTILTELGELVAGRPGPYILSDLRWGEGPLYVRYGGFTEQWCVGATGEQQPAIEDADGRLVPDRRGPTFQVPPWVTLPAFLAPHLEARNTTTVSDLPYRIERALHFSNGGGVYLAEDLRDGARVVLKEARPHAALDLDRADAVSRLRHERDVLEQLRGLDAVPALRDYFTLGEHEFLVEEFVEGMTLNANIVRKWPLLVETIVAADLDEYTEWALDVYAKVQQAVGEVHQRGIVIGDLHPDNILIRPDGRIVLIDLEVATEAARQCRPLHGAPGFTPPAGRTGLDIDRYALACLRLHLFLPLTTLFVLERGKAEEFATAISEVFPVAREFLLEAARVIGGDDAPTAPRAPAIDPTTEGWREARASLTAAILHSATPERDDRLFPGDVRQFFTNGLNLAYGAAGVLYALHATGAGRHPEHEEWLLGRALNPRPGTKLGFYDGLHGVAYALERLGRRDDAVRVLDICMTEVEGNWHRFGLDLAGGLAGMGLNLVHFAKVTGDASLWDAAWNVANLVADRLGDADSVPTLSAGKHPYAGLLRGSSGPALLFLHLHERSGDDALLELAATALRQDLRRCVATPDGHLEVTEGRRTMPYISDGSVGIGFVVEDYLTRRDDDQFRDALPLIRGAARGQFYAQPGLFLGRAGMILYLSRGYAPGTACQDPVVAAHVRRLVWHAMTYQGHLAFPGDQLLRLSMDLATGNAGVLLALGAALHDEPVELPFLGASSAHQADLSATDDEEWVHGTA
jgi:tRNA A-37 threonylcarbamoyl transferase component Bud32